MDITDKRGLRDRWEGTVESVEGDTFVGQNFSKRRFTKIMVNGDFLCATSL